MGPQPGGGGGLTGKLGKSTVEATARRAGGGGAAVVWKERAGEEEGVAEGLDDTQGAAPGTGRFLEIRIDDWGGAAAAPQAP